MTGFEPVLFLRERAIFVFDLASAPRDVRPACAQTLGGCLLRCLQNESGRIVANRREQARVNDQRRSVQPACACRQFVALFGVELEMARRIERECRAGQPVCVVIACAVGKPAGEDAEIGGAIAASAAPFVERGDRAEQLRDRRARSGTQQVGLRRFRAGT